MLSSQLRWQEVMPCCLCVLPAGSRQYVPAIYVINKIDQITIEELEVMDKLPHYCPVSVHAPAAGIAGLRASSCCARLQ